MLKSLGVVLGLGALLWVGSAAPGFALLVRISSGPKTVTVEDNGKQDREPAQGTIRYAGQINNFDVQLTLSEENTPGRQHALILSGTSSSEDPRQPLIINGGEPGVIAVEMTSSSFAAIGPRTSTQIHYQGQLTDLEDGRLAIATSENRLGASLTNASSAEVNLPAVQSQGEESSFDQTSALVKADGEATGLSAMLRLNLGTGDALELDEARMVVNALEASGSPVAIILGVGAAVVVVGGFLFLRPRRRRRAEG